VGSFFCNEAGWGLVFDLMVEGVGKLATGDGEHATLLIALLLSAFFWSFPFIFDCVGLFLSWTRLGGRWAGLLRFLSVLFHGSAYAACFGFFLPLIAMIQGGGC
jgi:hypothetical protein